MANDRTPNHLWLNQGGGRFRESALTMGCALDQDGTAKSGMGVDAVDVDDDGDLDLLVVNLDGESDSFFRNQGRFFNDDTVTVGLRTPSRPFTRFGMALRDFDNDGYLDLYEANGRVGRQSERYSPDPYAEPSLLFRGFAGPRFEEVTPRGGTRSPLVATSRAAAFGDIDNDGGIDIVVVNRDSRPFLLHNVVKPRGHWIDVPGGRRARPRRARRRDHDDRRIADDSPGRARGLQLSREQRPAACTSDSAGARSRANVTVRWPDGVRESFGDMPARPHRRPAARRRAGSQADSQLFRLDDLARSVHLQLLRLHLFSSRRPVDLDALDPVGVAEPEYSGSALCER